jgi:hypothetical protein
VIVWEEMRGRCQRCGIWVKVSYVKGREVMYHGLCEGKGEG